jgi:hypothetical protein
LGTPPPASQYAVVSLHVDVGWTVFPFDHFFPVKVPGVAFQHYTSDIPGFFVDIVSFQQVALTLPAGIWDVFFNWNDTHFARGDLENLNASTVLVASGGLTYSPNVQPAFSVVPVSNATYGGLMISQVDIVAYTYGVQLAVTVTSNGLIGSIALGPTINGPNWNTAGGFTPPSEVNIIIHRCPGSWTYGSVSLV